MPPTAMTLPRPPTRRQSGCTRRSERSEPSRRLRAGFGSSMTLLQFRLVVTPQEVEGKLRGLRPYLKESGWSEEVLREGLQLDLSRVQYADFGALAQILLLVEGALRHRAEVRVALPLGSPRRGEREWIGSRQSDGERLRADAAIRAAVRHRQGALRFMHNSGFVSCLRPGHVPDIDSLCRVDFDHDSPRGTGE